MFFYIIDQRVKGLAEKRRTQKALAWIKSHQIAGEYHDASSSEKITELGTQAAHKRFKTIVVIGDDKSLTALLNSAGHIDSSSIAYGYIPVTKVSHAARELKLPDYRKAMRALATRKIISLQLLSINTLFFPLELDLTMTNHDITIIIDNKLKLSLPAKSISLKNNLNNNLTPSKPIGLTATTPARRIQSSKESSFQELKSAIKANISEPTTLRINAKSISLSSAGQIECSHLAKSFHKVDIGKQIINVRMIVAKTAGFKS